MKVKDCYSLYVEELLDEVPTAGNLPTKFDSGITIETVQRDYENSLNIFTAFANYLVERNRTKDLAKQCAAAKNALDARNAEAQRQSELIIDNYAERMNNFLAAKRQEFELETQRIELESAERVAIVRNAAERQHAKIKAFLDMLKFYRSFLDDMQKYLAELDDMKKSFEEGEESPEKFLTKNKFYYQVKEDCRVKMKQITKLLKDLNQD